MDWLKAKKYTVVMLVILNIVFLGFNIYKGFETKLSSERISSLYSLLNSKNITVTGSLPRNFTPLAQIAVSDYSFDYVKLQKIFMENDENVRRTDEYNNVVFISDTSKLSVKGGSMSFTSSYSGEADSAGVRKYTDSIISKINESFGNYKFYSLSVSDGSYTVKYYEKTDGKNVFSNFAHFTIKGSSVALALNYAEIGAELNETKNIYAADEAVYTALPYIKEDYEKANISNVELGYYVIGTSTGGDEYATPFYLIIANGEEYYINAYTGECF